MKSSIPQPTLTVAILTDRVDQRFQRALASAKFADQLLIILTADLKLTKTGENVRIVKQPTVTDFAEARNRAMTEVKTDWVFWLDSDEEISTELAREILDFINQTKMIAAKVWRQDYFHGQPLYFGEVGRAFKLRLAKNDELKFMGKVHEVGRVEGKPVTLREPLQHFPHPSIFDFLTKINKYAFFAAQNKQISQSALLLQMILFPPAKFFYTFVIKLGFFDGWRGLVYSYVMALHSLNVRIHIYEQKFV